MTRAHHSEHRPTAPDARLSAATAQLRTVAAPLLQPLDLSELVAAGVDKAANADGANDTNNADDTGSADNQPSSEQSS
jgi:hypothetical protein